jgi:hypothetical protein
MQEQTDLDDFEIVIRHRSGRYIAKIPQIGLYAVADSLPNVIDAIEIKKRLLVKELTAADALNEVSVTAIRSTTSSPTAQVTMRSALELFAAKAAIVLVLLFAAGAYATHLIASSADRQMVQLREDIAQLRQATKIGGASFWAEVEKEIAIAAQPANDIPAEKKERLLADMHVIVDRWRPFVKEAKRLFSDRDLTGPANQ